MAGGFMLLLILFANLILGLGLSGFLIWKASHWRRDYLGDNISDREYRRLIICMIGVNALTVAGITGLGCLFVMAISAVNDWDDVPFVLVVSGLVCLVCSSVWTVFLHNRYLRQPRLQRANPPKD